MATSSQQKQELFKAIWVTAENLRNSVDSWDFKSYILGNKLRTEIDAIIREHEEETA